MAAIKDCVYDQTKTTAMMADTSLNPVSKEKRGEIQITLTYDGVDIDAAKLNTALKTLGTVSSNFMPTRGNFNLIIS